MFSRILVFLTFSLAGTLTVFSQQNPTDSLLALLPTTADTNKVNLLNKISSSYWYSDPTQTIVYADQAIALGKLIGFQKGVTSAYNNKGVGFYQQNQYPQAMEWYSKALEGHKQSGNFQGEAWLLSNIGMMYWKQSKLDTAVQYYLQSMKIWEDKQVESEKASVFENLGNVYADQDDNERALDYYFKSLAIEKKYGAKVANLSMTYSNIGTAYLTKGRHDSALHYFNESLKVLDSSNIENRAVALSNMGLTYVDMKDFDKARPILENALKLQELMGDEDAQVPTLLGLAEIHLARNELPAAEARAIAAKDKSIAIDQRIKMVEAWQMLAAIAEKKGDFKNAFRYYKDYAVLRDSIYAKENVYQIAHLEASYHSDKKLALLQHENEKQAFRRNSIAGGLLALLIIAGLVLYQQRLKIRQNNKLLEINDRLRQQSILLEEQTKKLQELDKAKSGFFANISHEFRTPLTLILNGLGDKLNQAKDGSEKESFAMLQRNARRLLGLINQLLDLSKLEAGRMKLVLENIELNELIRVVHGSFSSLAQSKQINFSLDLPELPISCRLDPDKIEKILYNLVSNAFKFTPPNGTIALKVLAKYQETGSGASAGAKSSIEITVSDDGFGIPAAQLEHVFDRFYQGDQYYTDEQGTGIGLALTKELVELQKGKISARNNPEKGVCFTVELPLLPALAGEAFLKPETMAPIAGLTASPDIIVPVIETSSDLPSILVVEDNEDLRQYIRLQLQQEYQVAVAVNGKEGLASALATIPDAIVTDWMMPEMDGIELIRQLKTDERTSHIPVILLTALAGEESKLEGLATRADDYLTKPFDNRELLLRMRNLVESRRQLREKYSKELFLGPKKTVVRSLDEQFLEKVMLAVETHMGNPDFNMDRFGQEVGLSRMQLHRKLKALTNESPGDFLRSMRLKQANRLLSKRSGNVSEVAYEVGFNNLSYFSKCYKEQFGISPNETPAAIPVL